MKTVYLASAISLLLASGATLRAEAPSLEALRERLASGEPTRIVCFGDSITGAYYHTGGLRAWCDMLGIALAKTYPAAKLELFNAGISGHTTGNALARIETDVLAKKPHLVVVMFGMNDVTGFSPDAFEANLRVIAEKCREIGAVVAFCTPNSVYETSSRPMEKLAEFSERTRKVARELGLPLADCFEDYRLRREADETAWMLTMSDEIHPNMHGHSRFAETIAATISKEEVALGNVPPPDDALTRILKKLGRKEPVRIVAMSPYDRLLPAALARVYPSAEIEAISWPADSGRIADMRKWAEGIRGLKPDLVVPAVPHNASAGDAIGAASDGDFIRDYEWVLNYSFPFAGREWDVLPILPDVTGKVARSELSRMKLAREIVRGKDVAFLERSASDDRTAEEIVNAFVAERAALATKPSADSKAATP